MGRSKTYKQAIRAQLIDFDSEVHVRVDSVPLGIQFDLGPGDFQPSVSFERLSPCCAAEMHLRLMPLLDHANSDYYVCSTCGRAPASGWPGDNRWCSVVLSESLRPFRSDSLEDWLSFWLDYENVNPLTAAIEAGSFAADLFSFLPEAQALFLKYELDL